MSSPVLDASDRTSGGLIRWLRERPLLAACGLLLVVSTFFLAAPQIDFVVSGLFYDPDVGFDLNRSAQIEFLRDIGGAVVQVLAVGVALPPFLLLIAPESRLLVRPRVTVFMLLALALGPGLLVNGILKEIWGRARPRDVVEFGGGADFSPAWWISGQCYRNCSFVSGEAAAAFWLIALVFVVPKAWRTTTAVLTVLLATCVSFTRVVVGAHFVSDVLLAWSLTLLVILALQRLVLQGLPDRFDSAAEAGFRDAGRTVRRAVGSG